MELCRGFEAVLETTNRKERKDIVENEPLNDLRRNTKKRDWSVRPRSILFKSMSRRAFLEAGDDIQSGGLVMNFYRRTLIIMSGVVQVNIGNN